MLYMLYMLNMFKHVIHITQIKTTIYNMFYIININIYIHMISYVLHVLHQYI